MSTIETEMTPEQEAAAIDAILNQPMKPPRRSGPVKARMSTMGFDGIALPTVRVPPKGGVYFAQVSVSGPIKIGVSTNMRHRILLLQSSSPWEVRGVGYLLGADEDVERRMHARFRDSWMRREWFSASHEIAAFVRLHRGHR